MLGSNGHSGSARSNTRRSEVEATRSLIADLSWNNLSWQQAKRCYSALGHPTAASSSCRRY